MDEFIFKEKNFFGKTVEIVVYDITEKFMAEEIIEKTYEEGKRLHKIFNFYDESSELSILNKKRRLLVSDEFLEVLSKSLEVCILTRGKYNITLGKNFLQRKKGLPLTPLSECLYEKIKINGNEVELKHPDILIDFGSIAKGYIVDKMISFMKYQGGICSGLIDARGDIFIFGDHMGIIDIEHPRFKDEIISSIKIKNSGVATSGDYNQYSETFDKSHIINKKDLISVTVVAPTLEEADLYSTVLFVSGNKEIKKILDYSSCAAENKKIKAMTVDSKLNINYYNGFEKLIIKT